MDALTKKFFTEKGLLPDNVSQVQHITELLGQKRIQFPGSQPVSFESKTHLSMLVQDDFKVCEKTDGTRFLFYLNMQQNTVQQALNKNPNRLSSNLPLISYFIDREYGFHQVYTTVNLASMIDVFKPDKSSDVLDFRFILDGEVVADGHKKGEQYLVFYLFDALYVGKEAMVHQFLTQRLDKANQALQYINCVTNFDQIQLKFKKKLFVDKFHINEIIEQKKTLLHHSDGLIFTKEESPYIFGTTPTILKWKEPNENTVDLLLVTEAQWCIIQQEDGQQVEQQAYFAQFFVAYHGIIEKDPISLGGVICIEKNIYDKIQILQKKSEDNRLIMECYWMADKQIKVPILIGDRDGKKVYKIVTQVGGWTSGKQRIDKTIPNDRRTYESVLRAHEQFLDVDDIMKIIEGKLNAPGVCRKENPFLLKKQGLLKRVIEYNDY